MRAAIGWLELGNHAEAGEEIARIAPEMLEHPDVLEVRWMICAAGCRAQPRSVSWSRAMCSTTNDFVDVIDTKFMRGAECNPGCKKFANRVVGKCGGIPWVFVVGLSGSFDASDV